MAQERKQRVLFVTSEKTDGVLYETFCTFLKNAIVSSANYATVEELVDTGYDVIIAHNSHGEEDGLDLIKALHRRGVKTKYVLLSDYRTSDDGRSLDDVMTEIGGAAVWMPIGAKGLRNALGY